MDRNLKLMHGDCLDLMKDIPDDSIDLVLCDLPYGITACKWDAVIPFDQLWEQYHRIAKPNAAIVLTASQPFSSMLVASNVKNFLHSWIWDKRFAANFAQAKRQPLRIHEEVLVFGSMRTVSYRPQMTQREAPIKLGGNSRKGSFYRQDKGLERDDYAGKVYTEKYPESIIKFNCREDRERGLHPTQKPVSLMEYLIRTYTNEGDVVLDNCMGSGTTGVACIRTDRGFIGMELDENYFEVARIRIAEAINARKVEFPCEP
ncbi:DNA-methyltransferase [Pseudomonas sp.]|uniref:DNA-methyltransferase n=1 Tax=Pseudomonas sp. TaxID=306 RepID=UPI002FC783EA